MRPFRSALRAAFTAAAAVTVLAAGTGSAAAADQMGLGVIARAQSWYGFVPDGVKFCFHGERDAGWTELGQWTMALDGVRGLEQISDSWSSNLRVVDHCVTVLMQGKSTGSFRVEFGYRGVGSYVIGLSAGGATWEPATGLQPFAVDLAS